MIFEILYGIYLKEEKRDGSEIGNIIISGNVNERMEMMKLAWSN